MSAHRLVIKDAIRQIIWRVISALCGFLVIKIITPYLWPLRFWDYSTILKYFAIRSALADFGLYVIAVKRLWAFKNKRDQYPKDSPEYKKQNKLLSTQFGQFVGTRIVIMIIVYVFALCLAYFLPAYTSNIFLIRGLPIGMMFSAWFMTAGILQLPLQIFWKMEQLSVWLILARIAQLSVLCLSVFVLFTKDPLWCIDGFCLLHPQHRLPAFLIIVGSVLISIITQWIYVRHKSNKLLPLKLKFDPKFIKTTIKQNRKYWLSYYLSSFHTLIVLIFLSNFFPSSKWFEYTGIRALALALIEILLIVPSALGNSMLHKISNYSIFHKRKSFGNFITLIFWIWGLVFLNFFLFNNEIISLVGSSNYIGTSLSNPGSNTILPYLAIVLRLSFIKQVFNYLFIATNRQNVLLKINLTWVIIGISIWLRAIPRYGIQWWVFTQIILEIMFVLGTLQVAFKQKILPIISTTKIITLWTIIASFTLIGYFFIHIPTGHRIKFFAVATIFNIAIIGISIPIIKKVARGLTSEENTK